MGVLIAGSRQDSSAIVILNSISPKKDPLAQLLALNLEVTQRIGPGQPVTAPGVPTDYPDPSRLVTDDCVRAD